MIPTADVRAFLSTPHDHPPKYLLMLTGYFDESGHDGIGHVTVAGFVGDDTQWNALTAKWKNALGKRKSLHMNRLRFSHESVREFLATLGPIPHLSGLTPVCQSIRVSDYWDLVAGTRFEKASKGYLLCLFPMMRAMHKYFPKQESIKMVFEEQREYEIKAHIMFDAASGLLLCDGQRHRFSGIEFIPKGSSMLTEPADYFAYAIYQYWRDRNSQKSQWCKPILRKYVGYLLAREDVRKQVRAAKNRVNGF